MKQQQLSTLKDGARFVYGGVDQRVKECPVQFPAQGRLAPIVAFFFIESPFKGGVGSAKYAALTLAGIILFRAGQARALTERGYAAVGGEGFALLLPAFYYLISRAVRDMIEDAQNGKLQK